MTGFWRAEVVLSPKSQNQEIAFWEISLNWTDKAWQLADVLLAEKFARGSAITIVLQNTLEQLAQQILNNPEDNNIDIDDDDNKTEQPVKFFYFITSFFDG